MHHMTPQIQFRGATGYEQWADTLAQQCGAFQPEPPSRDRIGTFEGQTTPSQLMIAGYAGAKIASNAPHVRRDATSIKRDSHDFFYLVHQTAGTAIMQHCSTQCSLTPGDLVLLDSARPSDFYFPGMSEQISLVIPRHKLSAEGLALNQKIPAGSKVGAVAGFMTHQFFAEPDTDANLQMIMETLVGLIRSALTSAGPSRESYGIKVQRSYFEKAKRFIEAELSNFDLSPDLIAGALGTSKRTLHRIFADQGISIGRYILNQRLDHCASELGVANDIQKVSAVAFAWGFNDVSHFSRTFKARFGVSPRDFRTQPRAPGQAWAMRP